MTQPKDKMRAEFEVFLNTGPAVPEWVRGDVFDHATAQYPGEYRDMYVQMMWDAWQAACAQQSAQSQQDALDAARSNGVSWDSGFLTVVYRGVAPGPEAQELCTHPKASAMSWSHAINDRDAAIAAKGASNV